MTDKILIFSTTIALLATSCAPATTNIAFPRPGGPEPVASPPSNAHRVTPITSLRLKLLLLDLVNKGMGDAARAIESALGHNPRPEDARNAIEAATHLLSKADEFTEPAYCADPALASHMRAMITGCIKNGSCPRHTRALEYIATRDQYREAVRHLVKHTVLFPSGKWTMTEKQRRMLKRFVDNHIKNAPTGTFVAVIGRYSPDGNRRRNLEIAANRGAETSAEVRTLAGGKIPDSNVGFTAYDDEMFVSTDDGQLLAIPKADRLSAKTLNRSATVFVYSCPSVVTPAVNAAVKGLTR